MREDEETELWMENARLRAELAERDRRLAEAKSYIGTLQGCLGEACTALDERNTQLAEARGAWERVKHHWLPADYEDFPRDRMTDMEPVLGLDRALAEPGERGS